jgi:hypothetical protein
MVRLHARPSFVAVNIPSDRRVYEAMWLQALLVRFAVVDVSQYASEAGAGVPVGDPSRPRIRRSKIPLGRGSGGTCTPPFFCTHTFASAVHKEMYQSPPEAIFSAVAMVQTFLTISLFLLDLILPGAESPYYMCV